MGLLEGFAFDRVKEAEVREGIVGLLNLVEEQHARVQALEAENERLRAENRRLKGETPKPAVRAKRAADPGDRSSEAERKEPREWRKGSKRATLRIDREEVCRVDPAVLPPDAEFKGYAEVVVQDVVVRPDVILLPERDLVLAEPTADVPGRVAGGLRGRVRAAPESAGLDARLCGPDERAEDSRGARRGRAADLGRGRVEPADQADRGVRGGAGGGLRSGPPARGISAL